MPAANRPSGQQKRTTREGTDPKRPATKNARPSQTRTTTTDGLTSLAEQFANHLIRPLGLVMLTRERIQETLDDAVRRGRMTRSDANDLVAELVRLGLAQTDELLGEIDKLFGRGREQLETATRRARLTNGKTTGDPALPIAGYDDMTAAQVSAQLPGLTAAQLRTVADYERRHANRKSVLAEIDKALR